MSSSNTRQSTVTAMSRGNRDSLGTGYVHKGLNTRRTSYRRTASLASVALALNGRRQKDVQKREKPPQLHGSSRFQERKESSPNTNVYSPSIGDGARGAEPNGFKGEGRSTALSLKVPSQIFNHNHGTESDDEADEIGALIYDQVMRQRQPPLLVPMTKEACL